MNKIKVLIASLILLLTFNSCSDWLTVEPQATATKDKIFSTDLGYQSALTGLYLTLLDIYTPTGFMMGGDLEYMACDYPINNSTSTDYQLSVHNYSYTDVDSELGSLFTTYYKIIANANVLLEALDNQQVLTPEETSLIKGEALAIRAFCHSEVLRLWGPIPTAVNKERKYLPYVKVFQTGKYEYSTYDQYVHMMMGDFTEADSLLSKVDPIIDNSNGILNQGYGLSEKYDNFWYYRQKRFNVYGVEALMARMYLWTGERQKAYELAKKVVSVMDAENGQSKFTLGTQSDIGNKDYLFYKEHLVGLDIHDFTDKGGAFSGRFASYVMDNNSYQRVFTDNTDIRNNLIQSSFSYGFGQNVYGTKKYMNMTETDYASPKSIPLMRLSELYLILMETAPLDEANEWYRTFASVRGVPYSSMSESTRQQTLIKEYVREFWSEEQIYFVYKRFNLSNSFVTGASMSGAYDVPLPSGETGDEK